MIDLHVHSAYCDGKSTPEELVLSAIEKGVKTLGIVAHSYTPFEPQGTLLPTRISEFQATVSALKQKYAAKLELFCGLEADAFSVWERQGFDYVIGSVHFLKAKGKIYPIDLSRDGFCKMVQEGFDGDGYAAAESYFSLVSALPKRGKLDLVGHFDLITKFNEGDGLFSTKHPRYIAAWQKAADALLAADIPFEVNTGAISRGYRTEPYPSAEIRAYIKARGGRLLLSSDAHEAKNVAFGFSEYDKI